MLQKIAKTVAKVAFATTALSVISSLAINLPASSGEIRLREVRLYPASASARVREGQMFVVDRDTTVPASDGKMRLYDLHVAKMIALANQFYCAQPYSGGIEKVMVWEYWAGNGDIDMGKFSLPCTLVKQLVSTYGLGKTEPVTVLNFVQVRRNNPRTEVVNVRTLDISDGETERFLQFVQTLKL